MKAPKIKAVILDLDGTLIDSLEGIAEAANFALNHFHFATVALEKYRMYVGNGEQKLFERILPLHFLTSAQMPGFRRTYQDFYLANWKQNTVPYPEVHDLLTKLVAAKIKVSVLSNKRQEFTRQIVSELFGDFSFDSVLGATPERPLKPDPSGALEIASRLSFEPSQFALVGDTPMDIETAQRAKMLSVGVTWGFRTFDELKASGADLIISSPQELLNHLNP